MFFRLKTACKPRFAGVPGQLRGMVDAASIGERFRLLSPHLDERGRRLFAAAEAKAVGRGGIAAVSRATGMAASTISRGLKELAAGARLETGRGVVQVRVTPKTKNPFTIKALSI